LYPFDALRIVRKLPRPDVVSVQDPFEAGFIGLLLARMKGAPLHVQVHTDFLSPAYAQHSVLNRIRVCIAGFVLRRSARVRVVSASIKEKIEQRYRPDASVTVIPLFFDAERFRNAQSNPALASRFERFAWKLLYVGRLESEKNVELSVRAFAQSAPADSCLIILGDGSCRTALEDRARELGVSDRIFFEGQRDPAPYYALADLVLLSSLYEGYPAVVAEALSAGKPVLSTDAGAAREIGAIIAQPGEFEAALKGWFENGPRTGELKNYPYKDFDEYVRAYCDDILACVGNQKK
jgi:glycosyltransferase involved in cell wall biosynthesis